MRSESFTCMGYLGVNGLNFALLGLTWRCVASRDLAGPKKVELCFASPRLARRSLALNEILNCALRRGARLGNATGKIKNCALPCSAWLRGGKRLNCAWLREAARGAAAPCRKEELCSAELSRSVRCLSWP